MHVLDDHMLYRLSQERYRDRLAETQWRRHLAERRRGAPAPSLRVRCRRGLQQLRTLLNL